MTTHEELRVAEAEIAEESIQRPDFPFGPGERTEGMPFGPVSVRFNSAPDRHPAEERSARALASVVIHTPGGQEASRPGHERPAKIDQLAR
jgi:hypothetical protein